MSESQHNENPFRELILEFNLRQGLTSPPNFSCHDDVFGIATFNIPLLDLYSGDCVTRIVI